MDMKVDIEKTSPDVVADGLVEFCGKRAEAFGAETPYEFSEFMARTIAEAVRDNTPMYVGYPQKENPQWTFWNEVVGLISPKKRKHYDDVEIRLVDSGDADKAYGLGGQTSVVIANAENEKEIEVFCEKAGITVAQFHGEDPFIGNLYLDSTQELPDGFSPKVFGTLSILELKVLPKGFRPVVTGWLLLDDVEEIPEDFDPVVLGNVYMENVHTIHGNFLMTFGGDLSLDSLQNLPRIFAPVVGGCLWLTNTQKVSEMSDAFNPKVGRELYMGDKVVTKVTVPSCPPAMLQWHGGKYVSTHGILLEVANRHGMAIEGRTLDGRKACFYGRDDVYGSGADLDEAKKEYESRVRNRKNNFEIVTRVRETGLITVKDYYFLTQCDLGDMEETLEEAGIDFREGIPLERMVEISKGKDGHDDFKGIFSL